jgi:hypothetical protein
VGGTKSGREDTACKATGGVRQICWKTFPPLSSQRGKNPPARSPGRRLSLGSPCIAFHYSIFILQLLVWRSPLKIGRRGPYRSYDILLSPKNSSNFFIGESSNTVCCLLAANSPSLFSHSRLFLYLLVCFVLCLQQWLSEGRANRGTQSWY